MRSWLKEARTAKSMTMAEIAERLGITESYYSYIENGERQKKMDITFVIRISEILGISTEKIIESEKELSANA